MWFSLMRYGRACYALEKLRLYEGLLALHLCLCPDATADSTKRHCRLEQLVPSASALHALAVAVNLDGSMAPLGSCQLLVGGEPQGAPVAPLRPVVVPALDIALLVQTTADYEPAAEELKEALHGFLRQLPASSRIELITYSDVQRVRTVSGFRPPAGLHAQIDALSLEGEAEPPLIMALRTAMDGLLSTHRTEESSDEGPRRRLIVIVSDGMNSRLERSLFREMGQELAKQSIPVFPIAFSPQDIRTPLRNLGELARRSHGTFRWARDRASLQPQFESLAHELGKVQLLKFPMPELRAAAATELTLTLRCSDGLSSNSVSLPAASLRPCSRISFVVASVLGMGLLAALGWGVGRRLKANRAAHPASAEEPASLQPSYYLIFVRGPLSGKRFPLHDVQTLGRAPRDDFGIMIPDASLADTHCKITKNVGGVWLESPGNKGVYCNETPISGRQVVPDGALIRLGQDSECVLRRS